MKELSSEVVESVGPFPSVRTFARGTIQEDDRRPSLIGLIARYFENQESIEAGRRKLDAEPGLRWGDALKEARTRNEVK